MKHLNQDWVYQLYVKEQITSNMNYKLGSRGPDVRQVQSRLGALVTGVFDTDTHRRVVAFQQQNGLDVSGIVCDKTWLALFPPPPAPQVQEVIVEPTPEPTEEPTTEIPTTKKK
jgi:murein L,D-transpeptidase YcbB/YkuD